MWSRTYREDKKEPSMYQMYVLYRMIPGNNSRLYWGLSWRSFQVRVISFHGMVRCSCVVVMWIASIKVHNNLGLSRLMKFSTYPNIIGTTRDQPKCLNWNWSHLFMSFIINCLYVVWKHRVGLIRILSFNFYYIIVYFMCIYVYII